MALPKSEFIWFDGELVPWDEAKIHVLSHVVHYGSSIFEGIRCYKTPDGPAIFRLEPHLRRMYDSCKVYRIEIPFPKAELAAAIQQTILQNKLESCYIRPIVFRGYGQLGVEPRQCPLNVVVAVWEWGAYLGPEALENGVDVGVSSWRRMAPDTFPASVKAGGHYTNSQLIRMEAADLGYDEGIALDAFGFVSEGSGENLFVVRDGVIYTPDLASSILGGITRDAVITLAKEHGYDVIETALTREQLYMADELFFTGTAAEITPVRSVDRIVIGPGRRGPVTAALQKAFFEIVEGRAEDRYGWLTAVER